MTSSQRCASLGPKQLNTFLLLCQKRVNITFKLLAWDPNDAVQRTSEGKGLLGRSLVMDDDELTIDTDSHGADMEEGCIPNMILALDAPKLTLLLGRRFLHRTVSTPFFLFLFLFKNMASVS